MKAKTIIILVLIALFLIILFQNTQVVELRLLFWTISMSRIILFPLTLLVGIIIGFVLGRYGKKEKPVSSGIE
ncbi:MAG: lipopolysaccharide assembly protein LapA domain-containing protein [Candidatus Stygibacter australis]|nr:lipopolysaccharide assembly protein LapA domain-containing protein [Candidatus Stygibacter australis]MDP8321370.1 lipopolysaccharide assembly protein LapA domain-containing protein [Candidatus Stygibacter australis]